MFHNLLKNCSATSFGIFKGRNEQNAGVVATRLRGRPRGFRPLPVKTGCIANVGGSPSVDKKGKIFFRKGNCRGREKKVLSISGRVVVVA